MNSYEQITQKIIENLEKANTWSDMISYSHGPVNITGRPYNGINLMLLYNTEYSSKIWGTFKQIIQHGGKIKKGEKSSIVAFWSRYKPAPSEENKNPEESWYLKIYRVFNVSQCEFIDGNEYLEYLEGKLNTEAIPSAPQELVDDYLNRECIAIQRFKKRAVPFYSPGKDAIGIPESTLYKSNDEYFMTLYHELVHSSGHPKRLNRFEVNGVVFNKQDYSLEELVAEIGANFLAAETAIKPDFLNSVSYVKHWVNHLKDHPRWIVSAAAKAEAATKFILKGVSDGTAN